MAEDDRASGLVLRAPRSVRLAGALAVLAGAGLIISGLVSGGDDQAGVTVFGLGLVVLAVMPFRMRVDASSGGLLVNGGLRTQRLGWNEIESFRVLAQRWSGNGPGLYALLGNGNMVLLPLPFGGGAVRSKRGTANLAAVRDQLESARLAWA